MAYTPINWQTGDTITADKLNRCDNGWGVGTSQLFSETVTTADQDGMISGTLAYSSVINSSTLTVTFGGTEYDCDRIIATWGNFYGGYGESGPDFSDYPFLIMSGDSNILYTQTAGTHTIAASGDAVECGDSFTAAVSSVLDQVGVIPFELVEGVTLESDAASAFNGGRLVYFNNNNQRFFVSKIGYGDSGVKFVPESSDFTAGFSYDYNTFYLTYL